MKVLITGATGFVGLNVRAVLPPDWDVTWTAHVTSDLSDAMTVMGLAQKGPFDVILHLAGRVNIPESVNRPDLDLRDNAFTTLNIARYVKCKHLIYVSTGAVYEGQYGLADPTKALHPSLPYAVHKLLGEHYVRAAVERWRTAERATIVRFFGCFGPYEPVTKLFARLARTFVIDKRKAFAAYGDGMNLVDAMWAPDAASALLTLMEDQCLRDDVWTVDLCRGTPMMVDDVVRIAGEVLLGERPEASYWGTANEHNLFYGDPDTFQRELPWRPTLSVADGFRAYEGWLLHRPESKGMEDV